jgi:hypothetical protein
MTHHTVEYLVLWYEAARKLVVLAVVFDLIYRHSARKA